LKQLPVDEAAGIGFEPGPAGVASLGDVMSSIGRDDTRESSHTEYGRNRVGGFSEDVPSVPGFPARVSKAMRFRRLCFWGTLILAPAAGPLAAQQSALPIDAAQIYRRVSPAVVLIEALNLQRQPVKQGTGFLVGSDGRILTNFHVIAHSKYATVRLANGDAYDDIEVLSVDQRKDIALIRIKAVELVSVALGRSSSVEIGSAVYAVGNPLGLQNTISQGLVSGVRQFDGYQYFQISAPISPGSSGGPVMAADGTVIGIAVGSLEGGQNLNFAIPIDYAKGMLTSNQPQPLAAFYQPEPEGEATLAGLQGDFTGTWKLNVDKSTPDGPAGRVYINEIRQGKSTIEVTTKATPPPDGLVLDGTFKVGTPATKPIIDQKNGHFHSTRVFWEGTTLVFEIIEREGSSAKSKPTLAIRESWVLSPNGKTLTKFRRTPSAGKVVDQKYTFEKTIGAISAVWFERGKTFFDNPRHSGYSSPQLNKLLNFSLDRCGD